MHAETDIRRVAAEYGLDAEAQIAVLRPFLNDYLELVFADDSFEIITGGHDCAEALAAASGLSQAAAAFVEIARQFPGAMLGLKRAVGSDTPATLYHRSMLPLANATTVLAALDLGANDPAGTSELLAQLAGNATLYGLGFTELDGSLRLKTYVLGEVGDGLGFRSLRMGRAGVESDVRLYTPEAGSDCTAAIRARRALGVTCFGHVAHSKGRATKVYVERIGKIATNYSAR
jgi:hypothetical protein